MYFVLTALTYNWKWLSPEPWYYQFMITDQAGTHMLGRHGHLSTLDRTRKVVTGGEGIVQPLSAWGPVGYHLTSFMSFDELARKVSTIVS